MCIVLICVRAYIRMSPTFSQHDARIHSRDFPTIERSLCSTKLNDLCWESPHFAVISGLTSVPLFVLCFTEGGAELDTCTETGEVKIT